MRIGARRKIPNTSLMSYVTRGVMFPAIASVMTQLNGLSITPHDYSQGKGTMCY